MAPVSLSTRQSPYSGLQSPLYGVIPVTSQTYFPHPELVTLVSWLSPEPVCFHSNPRVLQALALAVPLDCFIGQSKSHITSRGPERNKAEYLWVTLITMGPQYASDGWKARGCIWAYRKWDGSYVPSRRLSYWNSFERGLLAERLGPCERVSYCEYS